MSDESLKIDYIQLFGKTKEQIHQDASKTLAEASEEHLKHILAHPDEIASQVLLMLHGSPEKLTQWYQVLIAEYRNEAEK